jgi:hypothetical protein
MRRIEVPQRWLISLRNFIHNKFKHLTILLYFRRFTALAQTESVVNHTYLANYLIIVVIVLLEKLVPLYFVDYYLHRIGYAFPYGMCADLVGKMASNYLELVLLPIDSP